MYVHIFKRNRSLLHHSFLILALLRDQVTPQPLQIKPPKRPPIPNPLSLLALPPLKLNHRSMHDQHPNQITFHLQDLFLTCYFEHLQCDV